MRLPALPSILIAIAVGGCHGRQPVTADVAVSLDPQLEAALIAASDGRGLDYYLLPSSDDFAAIPQDPKNPITQAKIDLGRLLFHEPAIGREAKLAQGRETYSCATCHHAKAGFQAGVVQGIGEGGIGFGAHGEGRRPDPNYPMDSVDVQPIRTPSTLNVAYQTNVLWSGGLGASGVNRGTKYAWMPNSPLAFNRFGFAGVETQAIAAMNVHRMSVDDLMEHHPGYRHYFDEAFADVPANRRYTRRHAGLAIAAYERTLLANQAPFQQWLRGDPAAMSPMEKEGAFLFFGKAQCFTCHNGPALNSMRFEAIGMKDLYEAAGAINAAPDSLSNFGRGGFSGREEHMYAFKVPQLYNLVDAEFYGHGASFTRLRDVVQYKNLARPQNPVVPESLLSERFVPLGLTDREVDAITDFLTRALRDTTLSRYVPERLPSSQCFPNNDAQSRADLRCR